jgi:hypothetical protein
MKITTVFGAVLVLGVIGAGLYLLTRRPATGGASAGYLGGATGGSDGSEGAAYIGAIGGAVGSILGGIGSLYGGALQNQAGGKSSGAAK